MRTHAEAVTSTFGPRYMSHPLSISSQLTSNSHSPLRGSDTSAQRGGPERALTPALCSPPTHISYWRDQVALSNGSQWEKASLEDRADRWGHLGEPWTAEVWEEGDVRGGAWDHRVMWSGPSWPPLATTKVIAQLPAKGSEPMTPPPRKKLCSVNPGKCLGPRR